jgi:hypothetical protein
VGQGTDTADRGAVTAIRPIPWRHSVARVLPFFEGSGEVYSFSNSRYHQANETAVGGSHGDGEPLAGGVNEAGKSCPVAPE